MKTVLIVDADEQARGVALALLVDSFKVLGCPSLGTAFQVIDDDHVDMVLLDLAAETLGSHADPFGRLAIGRYGPAVVCTGAAASTAQIVDAMKRGASSFIDKPYNGEILARALRIAAAERRDFGSVPSHVSGTGSGDRRPGFGLESTSNKHDTSSRLLGDGLAMREVQANIRLYAKHDMPVLILGESGTGKELAAAEIHQRSNRRNRLFMPVDCASLPETLADSELFGTARGAFTGAVARKGIFEAARGGTVFLDEIGELPLGVQAKLLRTLESHNGSRMGSVELVAYDVRILSATNAPIFENPRGFRPELLNRLNTLILRMPPLRAHQEDIGSIARAFLKGCCPAKILDESAIEALCVRTWPGNVRELKNVVNRAAVLSGDRRRIFASDIKAQTGSSWGHAQMHLL